ncbi:hypothetical protein MTY414_76010 [Mycolicibacterium mageritense]|nr:hypothetical protein MTY414_76010 [Mycolicibacterium mageritense]
MEMTVWPKPGPWDDTPEGLPQLDTQPSAHLGDGGGHRTPTRRLSTRLANYELSPFAAAACGSNTQRIRCDLSRAEARL